MAKLIQTPTIGEILKEEFMEPLGISAYRLAHDIFVPVSRIQDIIHGRRQITVDTSLRLGKFFGVSDNYFLKMQDDINLRNARVELEDELNMIQAFK
ncbi:MAG: HigA family addiction module antidote protein [Pseudobutyrivibrio sp.]|nr:HigA family addiction module antidote protein [Pseudobutyrivibrio sp.]